MEGKHHLIRNRETLSDLNDKEVMPTYLKEFSI
jgi:hypothetical protein